MNKNIILFFFLLKQTIKMECVWEYFSERNLKKIIRKRKRSKRGKSRVELQQQQRNEFKKERFKKKKNYKKEVIHGNY